MLMKIVIVMTFFQLWIINIYSQFNPSLYTGIGTCSNLGGVIGIGTEVKYKSLSLNAAVGTGHSLIYGQFFTERDYAIDIGAKVYSKKNFFGGINYGYIETVSTDNGWFSTKEYYGFSCSMGYRGAIHKRLYCMLYIGATSHYLAFMPNEYKEKYFIPRFGLIIGYDFFKVKTCDRE